MFGNKNIPKIKYFKYSIVCFFFYFCVKLIYFIMKLKFYFSMMFLFLGFLSPSYASFPVESISTEITQTSSVEEEEMTSPVVANSGKSQVAALLLCFFIGIIGIHRFYLGYTWQGVVQILTL